MRDPPRSRSDLRKVEYALYSDMLRERRRKNESDADLVALDVLEVDNSDKLVRYQESVPPGDIEAVLLVVAELVTPFDKSRVRGADPADPPTWETLNVGGVEVRVPKYASIHLLPDETLTVPIWLRTWPENRSYNQYMQVYARAIDADAAARFLPDLISAARSEKSPYRNRIVDASLGNGGLHLRIVPTPTETRESLVLEETVWSAVVRNVDRMFERMSRLEGAGLGGNRGLLLAGPPGTGKTALCRALASEYDGRATVVIASAAVGTYSLGGLYERLDKLSPGLVLVEDLDLIAGPREDGGSHDGLIGFLTVLDGLMTRHSGVVTVATTNDPRAIDTAARRAARFDQTIYMDLPSEPARRAILERYLSKVSHTADLSELGAMSEGLSGADLREVVRSSVLDSDTEVIEHEVLKNAVERLLGENRRLPITSPELGKHVGSYL